MLTNPIAIGSNSWKVVFEEIGDLLAVRQVEHHSELSEHGTIDLEVFGRTKLHSEYLLM